jgi:hypothetical protein
MKRKKKYNNDKLKIMKKAISAHTNKFKLPNQNNESIKIQTNSWFDITEKNQNQLFSNDINFTKDKIENDGYYTKKIKLLPNDNQKIILLKWLDCYILMYNHVTKYFRTQFFNHQKAEFSITKVKKMFKNQKDEITN